MNEKTEKILEMFSGLETSEEEFLKEFESLSTPEQEYVSNVLFGMFKNKITQTDSVDHCAGQPRPYKDN
ncbi:MAG: hypothetical protein ACKPH7_20210 [Planktothrix sp.]